MRWIVCAISGATDNWRILVHCAAASDSETRFRTLADTMPQMVWSTLPDGSHDYYNARWYEFTGAPYGSTDGEGWAGMFHPDDQDRAWAVWNRSLTTGEPYEIEYRLKHHSGVYRWTLGRAMPIRDDEGDVAVDADAHAAGMVDGQRHPGAVRNPRPERLLQQHQHRHHFNHAGVDRVVDD